MISHGFITSSWDGYYSSTGGIALLGFNHSNCRPNLPSVRILWSERATYPDECSGMLFCMLGIHTGAYAFLHRLTMNIGVWVWACVGISQRYQDLTHPCHAWRGQGPKGPAPNAHSHPGEQCHRNGWYGVPFGWYMIQDRWFCAFWGASIHCWNCFLFLLATIGDPWRVGHHSTGLRWSSLKLLLLTVLRCLWILDSADRPSRW